MKRYLIAMLGLALHSAIGICNAQAGNGESQRDDNSQGARILCEWYQKQSNTLADGTANENQLRKARDFCEKIRQDFKRAPPGEHLKAAQGVRPSPLPQAALPREPLTPAPVAADDPCEKRLFVRSDKLDNRHFAVEPTSAGNAKGASVSYTDDRAAGTQTAAIDGIVSYVVLGSGACGSGGVQHTTLWAVAPWVSSSGTWNEPVKKTENEALTGGVDFQFGLLQPSFFIEKQFFVISPFDQTDFRTTAHAAGVDLYYEPTITAIYLGQSRGPIFNGLLNGYWQLLPEFEWRNVTSAGVTNLKRGDYEWFGGTIRGNLFLLTNPAAGSWASNPWIANRFSIIGTAKIFDDAKSSQEVRNYSLEVQYKLSGCSMGQEGDPNCQSSDASSSSISVEYDYGTDKDTLVFAHQYLAKLNYKY